MDAELMEMADNPSAFDSREYDRKIRQTLPYYDAFCEQTVDLVRAVFPGPVAWLDAGCGTGRMGRLAAESVPLRRFAALDVSEEMLRIARANLAGIPAEFLTGDIREMRWQDEFDVVTAVLILHFLRGEDRAAALRKCFDALKPGGLFISFENYAPLTAEGKDIGLARWRRFQLLQGKSPEEAQRHIDRYGRDYYPLTPGENLAQLRACGFRAAEMLWLSNMQLGVWAMK